MTLQEDNSQKNSEPTRNPSSRMLLWIIFGVVVAAFLVLFVLRTELQPGMKHGTTSPAQAGH